MIDQIYITKMSNVRDTFFMRLTYLVVVLLVASCARKPSDGGTTVAIDQNPLIIEPTSPTEAGRLENYSGCAFTLMISGESMELNMPDKREIDQITKILRYSGIPINFTIFKADLDNAFATIINNERYIVYGKGLLKTLDQGSGSYWSSMSILAHEIGHHLSGHTLVFGDNPEYELEADKFSGFVLYKMGASLQQSLAGMNKLGSETGSDSHPDKYQRMKAIQSGWEEAAALRYDGALPPPPDDFPAEEVSYTEFTINQMWSQEDIDTWTEAYGVENNTLVGERSATGIITEVYVEDYRIVAMDIHATIEEEGTYTYRYAVNSDNLCNACLSWFSAVLVPGRKIGFRYVAEGSADNRTITHLKALPAD